MTLHKFQTAFKTLMLDHPDALNTPPDIITDNLDGDGVPLPERLRVYRNNIVGSLTDVMLAGFPLLEKLVGKGFLEAMARSFILECPPATGCINTYGTGFDTFIRSFKPAQSMPYLADVATLEIALNTAYYAPDDAPMSAADLAQIAPEALAGTYLPLRRSACLVESGFPLQDILDFCLSVGADTPDRKLDISQGSAHLMIYRPALESVIVPLNRAEYAALKALQDGHTLGETFEQTIAAAPDFDIGSFLQKHIHLGSFRI